MIALIEEEEELINEEDEEEVEEEEVSKEVVADVMLQVECVHVTRITYTHTHILSVCVQSGLNGHRFGF